MQYIVLFFSSCPSVYWTMKCRMLQEETSTDSCRRNITFTQKHSKHLSDLLAQGSAGRARSVVALVEVCPHWHLLCNSTVPQYSACAFVLFTFCLLPFFLHIVLFAAHYCSPVFPRTEFWLNRCSFQCFLRWFSQHRSCSSPCSARHYFWFRQLLAASLIFVLPRSCWGSKQTRAQTASTQLPPRLNVSAPLSPKLFLNVHCALQFIKSPHFQQTTSAIINRSSPWRSRVCSWSVISSVCW